MKLSKEPFDPGLLELQDQVLVDSTGASILSTETTAVYQLKEPYEALRGIYFVTEVVHNYDRGNVLSYLPELLYPVVGLCLHFHSWNPDKDAPIPLVFNVHKQIILHNSSVCDNFLYRVFENTAEIVKLNENRWNCICCGRQLQVPFLHLRVCSHCEGK